MNIANGGTVWGNEILIGHNTKDWYYQLGVQDSVNTNKIHFVTSPHPDSRLNSRQWHAYFDTDTDTWHDSSGTDITANVPFDDTDGTQIMQVTDPVQSWIEDIALDTNGYPRVLLTYYPNYADKKKKYLYYSEWNGSAWTTPYQIHQSCNKNIGLDAIVASYAPLASFDPLDADRIICSKEISDGGQLELYELTRVAYNNFTSSRLTTTSASLEDQWRPFIVPSANYNTIWLSIKTYKFYGAFLQDLKCATF